MTYTTERQLDLQLCLNQLKVIIMTFNPNETLGEASVNILDNFFTHKMNGLDHI